jgi:ATP-dependent DNA ligase
MILNKLMYFYPEKPTLMMIEADAFQEMSDSDEWIAEPKFNGARCEVHLFNGHVEFWDRHGKHLKYNDDPLHEEEREKIKNILRSKFGNQSYFVFDGELRHNKVRGIQNKLVIYDVHVFAGELLNHLTFAERRYMLEGHFEKKMFEEGWFYDEDATVHLINQYVNDFGKAFDDYTQGYHGPADEFEGLVMKRLDGKLQLGRVSGTPSIWMMKVRKKTNSYRY